MEKWSVLENGMPFVISANHSNTYGRLSKYADSLKRDQEEGVYERAMIEKYDKTE
ncbi:hypothetical protein [Lachnoclostridium sp. An169]|uniref:hypothetical protein n=1 Tax=Lachnoclostridium sp. An169 TaxID=1965569 RepID=UPI0013A623E7|nr:hypothetical protein [Lachnoclostridium sp. An169]